MGLFVGDGGAEEAGAGKARWVLEFAFVGNAGPRGWARVG